MWNSKSHQLKASISGGIHSHNSMLERIEIYNKSPKLCLNCNNPIPYERRRNGKFCSHSCVGIYYNPLKLNYKPRNKKYICLFCNKEHIFKKDQKLCFCSINHRHLYNTKIKIENNLKVRPCVLRRYLIEIRGYRCEDCNLSTWKKLPIPLDVHHIDGDANNNKEENLKLLCKNCHGLTNNYGSKNIGNATRKYYGKK